MMNGPEKSDPAIVAGKSANKARAKPSVLAPHPLQTIQEGLPGSPGKPAGARFNARRNARAYGLPWPIAGSRRSGWHDLGRACGRLGNLEAAITGTSPARISSSE